MIYTPSAEHIELAAKRLKEGKLIVFPTETVYGLGANAFDADAVKKIFDVKGRPAHNPLIVHLAEASDISLIAWVPDEVETETPFKELFSLWPGPLTLVLPVKSAVPKVVTGGKDSVAVRVPRNPIALALLKASEVPIAAPSANISSRISATTAVHVEETIGQQVDMILDGGPCDVGVESTILSLLEWPPRILMPGGVSVERLNKLLGVDCRLPDKASLHNGAEDPLAPGMLKEHYAPNTKLRFRARYTPKKEEKRIGLINFGPSFGPPNDNISYQSKIVLSEIDSLQQVATRLYSALYEMDKLGLDLILIDSCEEKGIGLAIMDRLKRAVAASTN
ncbi:MAG: threonylcarbamoyl-AMP synthase [SAR324 cluster bacterium]|uniref:Threonylcarbamoyl-AMP synthase n=1 Tax=SAR324 cluster bacterium TaxID=2024889 RepID=A0A7X9FT89_9DELT|nr:threonylcarbamoyl-AMP synthase [SAR324 cluster bacterium]